MGWRVAALPHLVEACEHLLAALAAPTPLPAELLAHRGREVLLAAVGAGGAALLWERAETFAERLRSQIALDPGREWRAAELAERLAVSEATLRRRLADEGTGLRRLLEDVRLTQGANLLLSTDRPIKDIAAACGYDSPSRFAARFRERFGEAPSRIR